MFTYYHYHSRYSVYHLCYYSYYILLLFLSLLLFSLLYLLLLLWSLSFLLLISLLSLSLFFLLSSYMTRVNKNTRVLNHWPQLWRNNPFKEQQAFFIVRVCSRAASWSQNDLGEMRIINADQRAGHTIVVSFNASCMQVFQLKDEACDMCFKFIAFHSVNGEKPRHFGKITCF